MHKKKTSTALVRADEMMPDAFAHAMSEWRLSPPKIFITTLDEDCYAIERVDPKTVSDEESYLVVETASNRIVGILRNGLLAADIRRIPSSRTACTLFRAAKV
jgi:hypothetical protein